MCSRWKGFGMAEFLRMIPGENWEDPPAYLFELINTCPMTNDCPCKFYEHAKPYLSLEHYDYMFKIHTFTDRNFLAIDQLSKFILDMNTLNLYPILNTLVRVPNIGLVVTMSFGLHDSIQPLVKAFSYMMINNIGVNYNAVVKADRLELLGTDLLYPLTDSDYLFRYDIFKDITCMNFKHKEYDPNIIEKIAIMNNMIMSTAKKYFTQMHNYLGSTSLKYYQRFNALYLPIDNYIPDCLSVNMLIKVLHYGNVFPISFHRYNDNIYILIQFDNIFLQPVLNNYRIKTYDHDIVNEIHFGPSILDIYGLSPKTVIEELEVITTN